MNYYNEGFYKYISGQLFYGSNSIHGPDFDLLRENKDSYTYPFDGWYWFDTLQDACNQFNLNMDDYLPKEETIV